MPNKRPNKSPKKETTSRVSTIASKGLRGENLTKSEIKTIAASALSQDETKGQRNKK